MIVDPSAALDMHHMQSHCSAPRQESIVKHHLAIIIILIAIVCGAAGRSIAATRTWDGSSSNRWNNADNWNPRGVPTSSDDVIIATSASISEVPAVSVKSLRIEGSERVVRLYGAVSTATTLTITGSLDVPAGCSLLVGYSTRFIFWTFDYPTHLVLGPQAVGSIAGRVTMSAASNCSFTCNGDLAMASTGVVDEVNGSTFTLGSAATLRIGSADGITASGASGNIRTTSRTFPGTAQYVYAGAGSQSTGSGLPTTLTGTLAIANAGGEVTLSAPLTINGTLAFTSGMLLTGTHSITLGASATITGEQPGSHARGTVITARPVGRNGGNFGGLGVTLGSSLEDLGTVTITRLSGPAGIVSSNGSQGIARTWRISITGSQPTSGMSMTLSWVNDDNNGINLPATVRVWRSTDNGSTWMSAGPETRIETPSVTCHVTGFSDWTISDGNSPLPVELVSFGATRLNDAVLLRWKTATETNNYGFDVERSFDGNIWSAIGFVAGNGTTSSEKSYTYRDTPDWQAASGGMRYRLRQIDRDGTIDYSSVVHVSAGETVAQPLRVHPQPLATGGTATVLVTLPHAGDITLEMHDSMGRLVATFTQGMREAGTHTIATTLPQVARGVYALRATLDGTPLAVLPLLITR